MNLRVVGDYKKDVKSICLWSCHLLIVPQTIRKGDPYLKYGSVKSLRLTRILHLIHSNANALESGINIPNDIIIVWLFNLLIFS